MTLQHQPRENSGSGGGGGGDSGSGSGGSHESERGSDPRPPPVATSASGHPGLGTTVSHPSLPLAPTPTNYSLATAVAPSTFSMHTPSSERGSSKNVAGNNNSNEEGLRHASEHGHPRSLKGSGSDGDDDNDDDDADEDADDDFTDDGGDDGEWSPPSEAFPLLGGMATVRRGRSVPHASSSEGTLLPSHHRRYDTYPCDSLSAVDEEGPWCRSYWHRSWCKLKTRARYYIPALSWIPAYSRRDLPHDLIGGATVAFLLIPQGLSYASLAHVEPVMGLFTAVAPVAMYGLFGTSRQLSIGPEALVSMLVGSAVTKQTVLTASTPGNSFLETGADPAAEAASVATTLALLVGLFTFALGFFRFGFIDSMLSRALLRGFITAVALVIMIEQGPVMLGLDVKKTEPNLPKGGGAGGGGGIQREIDEPPPFEKFLHLLQRVPEAHIPSLVMALGSALLLVGANVTKQRLSQRYPWVRLFPEVLALVVGAIAWSWSRDWAHRYGVRVLGPVSSHLPRISIPRGITEYALVRSLMVPAVLISLIGFVESIVITKQYASRHNYPVSRNRELVALGLGNIAGSFCQAYPAFGSLARSRLNDRAGARTQLACLFSGAIVLAATMWLLPAFQYLPTPVMASIILIAALSLIETHDIIFMLRLRAWKDLAFLAFTFLATLLISVEAGVFLSIASSLVLVVKDVAVPRITILGRIPSSPAAEVGHSPPSPPVGSNGAPSSPPPLCTSASGSERGIVQGGATDVAESSHVAARQGALSSLKFRPVHGGEAATPITFPAFSSSSIAAERYHSSGIVVVRIDEPLHFANTGDLRERLLRAERYGTMAAHPSEAPPTYRVPTRHVVFDVRHMPRLDATAAQILSEVVEHYQVRQVAVSFVRLRPSLRKTFQRAGIVDLVGGKRRFVSRIRDALELEDGMTSDDRVQQRGKPPLGNHVGSSHPEAECSTAATHLRGPPSDALDGNLTENEAKTRGRTTADRESWTSSAFAATTSPPPDAIPFANLDEERMGGGGWGPASSSASFGGGRWEDPRGRTLSTSCSSAEHVFRHAHQGHRRRRSQSLSRVDPYFVESSDDDLEVHFRQWHPHPHPHHGGSSSSSGRSRRSSSPPDPVVRPPPRRRMPQPRRASTAAPLLPPIRSPP